MAASYAHQRVRDVDLFASWKPRLESLSMNDKVRVRHAHASLKIPCDVKISIADLSLSLRAQLAESVLLEDHDSDQLLDILSTLNIDENTLMSKATHRRLLLLRSGLRYLHKDAYHALPADQRNVLRAVHHRELEPPILKCTRFVDNLNMPVVTIKGL